MAFVTINTDTNEQLVFELRRIGNNINQIACAINQSHLISQEQLPELNKDNPGLMSFLSGFLFLPLINLFLLAEGQILKNFVKTFYFFKYRKEYREYFNITNEQWYGKFFARFMSKS